MDHREEGRRRGRESAKEKANGLPKQMEEQFAWILLLWPSLEGQDIGKLLRNYDRERLACEPDFAQFPEMRGLIDRHVGEREGFREASGLDETAAAFHYSWFYLLWRRLNAHHVPYWEHAPVTDQCTNVFFPEGNEGVTISDNRDLGVHPRWQSWLGDWRPDNGDSPWCSIDNWEQGGSSSAIEMDEEPECCFPCDPDELCPAEEAWDDINVRIEFMTRYREFWGPGNRIWIDRHRNAVAVEKSNCRVAYRRPKVSGAVCITACSYIDPEMRGFKQACIRKIMEAKGETEGDNLDWAFEQGAHQRYQRLCKLTNAEAARPGGATLLGALEVVADEAVPYPERICLGGQEDPHNCVPTYSMLQHAGVMTGPRRRWLYRTLEDFDNPHPITTKKLKLLLGEGVEMQPEWQADIEAGLYDLGPTTPPVPQSH